MTTNETYGNDWTDTLAARERGEVAGFQGADETNEAFAARTAREAHPAGTEPVQETTTPAPAKRSPARKPAAKKAPAKKSPAKKSPASATAKKS